MENESFIVPPSSRPPLGSQERPKRVHLDAICSLLHEAARRHELQVTLAVHLDLPWNQNLRERFSFLLKRLLQRHDVLRSNIVEPPQGKKGSLAVEVIPDDERQWTIPFNFFDFRDQMWAPPPPCPSADLRDRIQIHRTQGGGGGGGEDDSSSWVQIALALKDDPTFYLDVNGPLISFKLLSFKDVATLVMTFHHAVIDAESAERIMEEMSIDYLYFFGVEDGRITPARRETLPVPSSFTYLPSPSALGSDPRLQTCKGTLYTLGCALREVQRITTLRGGPELPPSLTNGGGGGPLTIPEEYAEDVCFLRIPPDVTELLFQRVKAEGAHMWGFLTAITNAAVYEQLLADGQLEEKKKKKKTNEPAAGRSTLLDALRKKLTACFCGRGEAEGGKDDQGTGREEEEGLGPPSSLPSFSPQDRDTRVRAIHEKQSTSHRYLAAAAVSMRKLNEEGRVPDLRGPHGMFSGAMQVMFDMHLWKVENPRDLWLLAHHVKEQFYEHTCRKRRGPWVQQRMLELLIKAVGVQRAYTLLGKVLRQKPLVTINNLGVKSFPPYYPREAVQLVGLSWWASGHRPATSSFIEAYCVTNGPEINLTLHNNSCRLTRHQFQRGIVPRVIDLIVMAASATPDSSQVDNH